MTGQPFRCAKRAVASGTGCFARAIEKRGGADGSDACTLTRKRKSGCERGAFMSVRRSEAHLDQRVCGKEVAKGLNDGLGRTLAPDFQGSFEGLAAAAKPTFFGARECGCHP